VTGIACVGSLLADFAGMSVAVTLADIGVIAAAIGATFGLFVSGI
jgi:hypothetical protein